MSRVCTMGCLVLVACLLGIGCAAEMNEEPAPGTSQARLRVLHLSPDAPDVDAFVDGAMAFSSLSFGSGTAYASLTAGEHDVDVSPAGASIEEAVISATLADLEAGASYTVVAYDTLAAPIGALVLADADTEIPSGLVRIRLIHTAVGVGEVDVWAIPTDGEPQQLYSDVSFGDAGEVLDVPPGTHTFGIDADDDASPDFLFALPDLSPGTYVNLFAVTDATGTPFLLAQLAGGVTARIDAGEAERGPAPGNVHVRALHLSPDAPDVDVFVNGGEPPAFSGVTFTWGTEYAEIPAGAYTFDVSATGSPASESVLRVEDLPLEEGASYTVVAFDSLPSIQPLALTDDYGDLAPGLIRLRAIHAAVGVGTVDISAITTEGAVNRLYRGVSFGDAGEYVDVPAGSYRLGFDVDDDGISDVRFQLPGLVAGTVANVYAVTDAAGDLFLLAQLRDGNTVRIDPSTETPATGDVRVLHLSPDAPAVDVFLNEAGSPIISGLEFGSGTGFASLPAGAYRVDVSASGSPASASVLNVDGLPIEAGKRYTVVAFDELGSIQPLALEDDFAGVPAGNIRVRAIHTAAGVGQVDVLAVPEHGLPSVLYDDVDFGAVGDYLELPAGAYTLGLDLDDDRVADALFRLPSLGAGTVANVFAVAEPTAVYLIAQLNDGTTARIDASH